MTWSDLPAALAYWFAGSFIVSPAFLLWLRWQRRASGWDR